MRRIRPHPLLIFALMGLLAFGLTGAAAAQSQTSGAIAQSEPETDHHGTLLNAEFVTIEGERSPKRGLCLSWAASLGARTRRNGNCSLRDLH